MTSQAFNMDCVEGMKQLDAECIDLTVTSPPYDNLRDYNGFSFDWKATIEELARITKRGGGGSCLDCIRSDNQRERNGNIVPASPIRYGVRIQSSRHNDLGKRILCVSRSDAILSCV